MADTGEQQGQQRPTADQATLDSMAAMGLPTTFGAPPRAPKESNFHQSFGRGRGNRGRGAPGRGGSARYLPANVPNGPNGNAPHTGSSRGFMRGRGAGWSETGDRKRKRGGQGNSEAHESTSTSYAHLPLDQIPTDALIRRSFTEDPWAHLA